MAQLNWTDSKSLEEEYSLDKPLDDIGTFSSDYVCISNNTICALFTILMFSSACSIIVAQQLLNEKYEDLKPNHKN